MRRNCNLELQLFPSPYNYDNEDHGDNVGQDFSGTDSDQSQLRRTTIEDSSNNRNIPNKSQPLTIFYNGKICVCDVNEFQAKAIILLANNGDKVGEERAKTSPMSVAGVESSSQLYSPNTAQQMKKSLQMFLQKRKHRAQATAPYHRR